MWAIQNPHQPIRSYAPFPTDLGGHSNSYSLICDRGTVEKAPGIQQLRMPDEAITYTQIAPFTRGPMCCICSPNLCSPWVIPVSQSVDVDGLCLAPGLAEAPTSVAQPLSSMSSSFPPRRCLSSSTHSSRESSPSKIRHPRVSPMLANNLPWVLTKKKSQPLPNCGHQTCDDP